MEGHLVASFSDPGIPTAVIAALIAAAVALVSSVVSLASTLLSNSNSRQQVRAQLAHDATQRDRERSMALRRDVYVPAAEALVDAQSVLGQLIDVESDRAALGRQFQGDLATLAKIHVVGSEKTVRALMTYLQTLMPTYLKVIMGHAELSVRKQAIATEKSLMDRADADLQRSIQLMKQHTLTGNPDTALWERLSRQAEAERASWQTHAERHTALWRAQAQATVTLFERSMDGILEVANTIPAALMAARSDLDMPLDAAEYQRMWTEQQRAVTETLKTTMEQLRARLPPLQK
jgi:hypothetical protein